MSRYTPFDWTGHRVVVIDIETTRSDRGLHVVEIGAVTLTGPRTTAAWSTPVRPPTPIDPTSHAIHQLSDTDVANAATFADIEPELTSRLTPTDSEQVIAVAHKTSFDIPVLRIEYERLGIPFPDIPTIDTLEELPAVAGINRTGRSLDATCADLSITRTTTHTALADAIDTARVFTALLDYCIPLGIRDFRSLLGRLRSHTTHHVPADLPDLDRPLPTRTATTAAHVRTHDVAYEADPAGWIDGAKQCAETACHLLAAKRRTAFEPDHPTVTPFDQIELFDQLLDHAITLETSHGTAASQAAFATVLGAFGPLLRQLPSNSEETGSPLAAVTRWAKRWGTEADRLGACTDTTCPDCTIGNGCPNELWPRWLATRLFDVRLNSYRPTDGNPKDLFDAIVGDVRPSSRKKSSTFRTLNAKGFPSVADELLELACRRLDADGHPNRAAVMRSEAWDYHGGRGPLLTRWKASTIPRDDAIDLCKETLARDDCLPGPGRRLLVTAVSEYRRLQASRKRRDLGMTVPPGHPAHSRHRPTRRAPSLFGLDDPYERSRQ